MLIFRFNPNRAIYYWLFSHSKIVRYVKLWLDFKIYEAPRWLFSKPILEYVSAVDSCKPVNRQKKLTCRLFPSLKILKWIFSTFTIAVSHYAILKINFFSFNKTLRFEQYLYQEYVQHNIYLYDLLLPKLIISKPKVKTFGKYKEIRELTLKKV